MSDFWSCFAPLFFLVFCCSFLSLFSLIYHSDHLFLVNLLISPLFGSVFIALPFPCFFVLSHVVLRGCVCLFSYVDFLKTLFV